MAHNIEYYTYEDNIKRDCVKQKLDHYVAQADWQEGCSGLPRPIRWLDTVFVYEDQEAAEKAIQSLDRGDYDQLAVRYYEYQKNDSKARQALCEKIKKAHDDYYNKLNPVWAAGLKAEFVSCRKCGSKLKREYIKRNTCPVCGADLRPESTLATIAKAKERWAGSMKALADYDKAHGKKKVMWLVKIEYHT